MLAAGVPAGFPADSFLRTGLAHVFFAGSVGSLSGLVEGFISRTSVVLKGLLIISTETDHQVRHLEELSCNGLFMTCGNRQATINRHNESLLGYF